MNPLDALSALTQVQLPTSALGAASPAGGAAPMGPANAITENFNLLQPMQGVQGTPLTAPAMTPLAPMGGAGGPSTWGHMMQQMVLDVNSKQQTAAQKVTDVLKGGPTPVHDAMVASEEASLSFEFLAEMRNKVVDAYQQVMQMQV
jgi:flagellar hook-basal body complex protein FliE